MFIAVGLTCFAGCGDKSAGSSGAAVSEAEWDAFVAKQIETFERQTKKYDEQLAIGDRQIAEIDQQNERYDATLDKWEEQQRRFDAILDRWERNLSENEAIE
jgi:hypothetical protein